MRLMVPGLLATICAATPAVAEDAPYAEYRVVREIGQIQITTGFIDRTPDLSSRLAALEGKGIIVLETARERSFVRTERVGNHRIETRIMLQPPVGHGEGGASSTVDLRMVVDGTTRVDCPLWHATLGLDRIVFEPDRGFLMMSGHEGVLRFDGFEPRGIVDGGWLEKCAASARQLLVGKR